MEDREFDFIKRYKDSNVFLNDLDGRCLSPSYIDITNISDISDEDLMIAILDDILSITMYELQFKRKIKFDPDELTRFIPDMSDKERIFNLLLNSDINRYIEVGNNLEIRLIPGRDNYQDAMDYVCVWYGDYDLPDRWNIKCKHIDYVDLTWDTEDNCYYLDN